MSLSLGLALTSVAVAQATADDTILRGRVLLPDGKAAAGAQVQVQRYLLRGTGSLDVERLRLPQSTRELTCADDGTFLVELPRGLPFVLRVRAARTSTEIIPRAYAGESLTLQLRRPALLEGIVTRAHDGKPVTARLRAWSPPTGIELLSGQTDTSGHFLFTQLPPETITIEVQPDDGVEPEWAHLVLQPGRTLRHDVRIESGELLRGEVRDALTDKPIAGAEVSEGWTFDRVALTDAQGRFALCAPRWDELHARAKGYGKIVIKRQIDPVLALAPGRRARGRMVDAAGTPLPNTYVSVMASEFVNGLQQTDWLGQFTGADGTFAFDQVRRDVPHCLYVRSDGHATLVYDFPTDESKRDEIDFGDIVVPKATYLTGRVLNEHGQPVVGAQVSLTGTQHDRYRFAGGKRPSGEPRAGGYVNNRATTTDSLGRYHFADLGHGTFQVNAVVEQVTPRLVGSGVVHGQMVTVKTTPDEPIQRHDFKVTLGRTLRGRILLPSGSPPPMTSLRYGAADSTLDSDPLLVQTGIPFRLFRLAAGRLAIEATPCDFSGKPLPESATTPAPSRRTFDPTGDQVVAVYLSEPQWVQVFVVDRHGQPVGDARVIAVGQDGAPMGERRTGADGSVTLFLGEQASARMSVHPPTGAEPQVAKSEPLSSGTANAVIVLR